MVSVVMQFLAYWFKGVNSRGRNQSRCKNMIVYGGYRDNEQLNYPFDIFGSIFLSANHEVHFHKFSRMNIRAICRTTGASSETLVAFLFIIAEFISAQTISDQHHVFLR